MDLPKSEPSAPRLGLPDLGVGVGLRIPHYAAIFDQDQGHRVDWFEIISENFMVEGGLPMFNLGRALERFRVVQHGVSLSIGSTAPLDWEYLAKLKALVKRTGSPWVSDHLCWTGAHGVNLHDLYPLPYTEEAAKHVIARAKIVQDYLETRFVLENVSSYLTFTASAMTEWEFVSLVANEADVGLLLDVNNVYVSSFNHGFDPKLYIEGVPHHRVTQIHLAGHSNFGRYILDTHSDHVIDPVWDLYRLACERVGPVSTLIEWDDDIPPFDVLVAEADKARAIRRAVLGEGRVTRGARPAEAAP